MSESQTLVNLSIISISCILFSASIGVGVYYSQTLSQNTNKSTASHKKSNTKKQPDTETEMQQETKTDSEPES